MKILVMGSNSFMDPGAKVGIQIIAEGLAKAGNQVDYISTSSSILDFFEKSRRSRFKRIWLQKMDKEGVDIAPNLKEYSFKSLFPVRKLFFRFKRQLRTYSGLIPKQFKSREYDLCINDTSQTFLYLSWVKAKKFVYRVNDLPSGFGFFLHRIVINYIDDKVRNGYFAEAWPVSFGLQNYIYSLNRNLKTVILPNGLDITKFDEISYKRTNEKKVVFIGAIEEWVDIDLIDRVAGLLPDWSFDFYGPLRVKWNVKSPNISYPGVLSHSQVSDTLKKYSVGLIPFCDRNSLINVMERPIKFYEYIASGLGVVSTDIGALRKGMGDWAFYGDTPDEFADAIIEASGKRYNHSEDELKKFLYENSWNSILEKILDRIRGLF